MKLCECGCGQSVRTPRHQFIRGHNIRQYQGLKPSAETRATMSANNAMKRSEVVAKIRGPRNGRWLGDLLTSKAAHKWVRDKHPKTGVSSRCWWPLQR